MREIKPLNVDNFGHQHWLAFENFEFARRDMAAPLLASEFSTAAMALPIGFIRDKEQYVAIALQGLMSGQNLFVDSAGDWRGKYIPAAYRAYPFCSLDGPDGQMFMGVDAQSGLLTEPPDGQPFFTASGEPTGKIREISDFLATLAASRKDTTRLLSLIDSLGLFKPWELKIELSDGERKLEGLFCIDEEKLNQLPQDALSLLHQQSALPFIYCQLLSMQNVQILGQLLVQRSGEAGQAANDIRELNLDQIDQTSTINFDNF